MQTRLDQTEVMVGSTERQFCTFVLGDLLIGVEVDCVQEVMLAQPMTRLPLTTDVVRGLINLRGQIVTAIDLRRRFGLGRLDEGREEMNVVVRDGEGVFSLVVDEIGDVVNVSSEHFELPPETLTGFGRELITGAYKLDGRLLVVLDVKRAVTLDDVIED